MHRMTLAELDLFLSGYLGLAEWRSRDNASNGLQVSCGRDPIRRVAFAVDACLASFERASEEEADLVFVHHGLYWGKVQTLTGEYYRRVRFLMEKDMGLYAAHLPLDAHPEVGNNAGMAQALGLAELQPFGEYKGAPIGWKGRFPEPRNLEWITEILFGGRENALQILPFGKPQIRTVGLVSGGATYEVQQAIDQGLDLYITGDASHTVYHAALEAGINVIFGGHYATETWGVRLLSDKLAKETGLSTVFIDLPTGL